MGVTLSHSTQTVPTLTKQPRYNIDDIKTPSLQKVEQEKNLSNHQVKQIAREAFDSAIQMLQKNFANTDYQVSYTLDEMGASRQVKLSTKSTGDKLAELPPDVAVQMAERSKQQTKGLLFDLTA